MAFVFSNEAQATLIETLESAATTAEIDSEYAELFAEPTGGNLQRCILRDDTEYYEIIDISANAGDGSLTIVRARESTSAREWPPGTLISQYLSKEVLESFQS